ncbi:uncharacterized protein MP3633_3292 [Marinomonas primoryensis]|uniref:Uncharacterized protein n=1 Tax=Marinomonas primoryensis TaxID=178399 RepID=A0A859D504_9GAMM|nr:uncharacterized protein MP3633_3292 [Marinomonas primoryensis]
MQLKIIIKYSNLSNFDFIFCLILTYRTTHTEIMKGTFA